MKTGNEPPLRDSATTTRTRVLALLTMCLALGSLFALITQPDSSLSMTVLVLALAGISATVISSSADRRVS